MRNCQEDNRKPKLGLLIKSLLKEQSLSMHKLSALTGIDTATISRIANDKQSANANHLQKIAHALHIPTAQLFLAAGYDVDISMPELKTDMQKVFHDIQEILHSSNIIDEQCSFDQIQQELYKYENYARTEEGKKIIIDDFQDKVNQVQGAGPFIDQLKQMYQQFCAGDVPSDERSILGSALLYFILSADIIPDYVFPIGYFDDAVAITLALNRLSQFRNSHRIPDG